MGAAAVVEVSSEGRILVSEGRLLVSEDPDVETRVGPSPVATKGKILLSEPMGPAF